MFIFWIGLSVALLIIIICTLILCLRKKRENNHLPSKQDTTDNEIMIRQSNPSMGIETVYTNHDKREEEMYDIHQVMAQPPDNTLLQDHSFSEYDE